MSDPLDDIRSAVGKDNLSRSLSRDECTADTAGLPAQRVIVDADRAFPAHRWTGSRCDFIVFYLAANDNQIITVPLELKSGKAEVSHASKQLQHGADFAANFAPTNAVCHPVLIYGKRINLRELNRAKVQFRDRRITVKAGRCNRRRNLADALSTA